MTAPLKHSASVTVDVALGDRAYDIVIGRDVPLADAGALHDPVIGRVDSLSQFGIGQNPLRQI